jgi:hypothetical protein
LRFQGGGGQWQLGGGYGLERFPLLFLGCVARSPRRRLKVLSLQHCDVGVRWRAGLSGLRGEVTTGALIVVFSFGLDHFPFDFFEVRGEVATEAD